MNEGKCGVSVKSLGHVDVFGTASIAIVSNAGKPVSRYLGLGVYRLHLSLAGHALDRFSDVFHYHSPTRQDWADHKI